MLKRTMKIVGLVVLMVVVPGATGELAGGDYCIGPCAPEGVWLTLDQFDPPSGSTVTDSGQLVTFSGSLEWTAVMAYSHNIHADYAHIEKWDGERWVEVQTIHYWDWGPREEGDHTCGDKYPISIESDSLPWTPGENRFRAGVHINGSDMVFYEGWYDGDEVVYTYAP